MNLTISGTKASADILEESWDHLDGPLNPKYKSKGSIPFIKFGDSLIVESTLANGGRELRDGQFGGIARVEGQAEGGFYQYKFICKR